MIRNKKSQILPLRIPRMLKRGIKKKYELLSKLFKFKKLINLTNL